MRTSPSLALLARYLFAIPWIAVAIQHFIYADFVATIVPAYMPSRVFWVYFTAIAMIAAGIAIMANIQLRLASALLAIMMFGFLVMIHPGLIIADPHGSTHWTRFFQDIAIMGISLIFTWPWRSAATGKYIYAAALIFLGAQHFYEPGQVTGRIPNWAAPKPLWDGLTGGFIVFAAIALLLGKWPRLTALLLGSILLFLAFIYHLPILISDLHNGGAWTPALLDIMVASGGLALASLQSPVHEENPMLAN